MPVLITLVLIFGELSLISFGGGNTILPEMQRRVVDGEHWVTAEQFSALFALAQAAPGPNMMIAPLIGWRVAGLAGVLVTTIAKFLPSSLITAFAFHIWEKAGEKPWRRAVQAGLAPVTAGLVAASAAIIAEASATNAILAAITAGSAIITARTKTHPLIVLGSGAAIGLIGLGSVFP